MSCSAHVVLRMLSVRRVQRMVGGVRVLLLATFVVVTMMVMAVLAMLVLVRVMSLAVVDVLRGGGINLGNC